MDHATGPDYWAVLGLEPGADAQTLKRAFRTQARRWHPDLNGSDPVAEERFKRVNEAYAVLSDPRRRAAWEAGEQVAEESADPFASGFPDFSTYLDALLGGTPRREGNGARERAWESDGIPARLELVLRDGTCVEVWTPPLAGDGWRLRLAGVAPGGADHFLQLQVRSAEGLRIDGLRVLYHLELPPEDAVLGCDVTVPTLEGPVRLRVPPGSSSGRLLRLRGRGLSWGERRGDQLVEIRVVVPEHLGEAERALYQRLRQLARPGDDHS